MQTDPRFAVDLTNCDREPIHLLGAIQPFGFLLAVSEKDWRITRASRNAAAWLGMPGSDLLGRPLSEIFTAEAMQALRGHLQSAILGDTVSRAFDVTLTSAGLRGDLAVHAVNGTVVIEYETGDSDASFNVAGVVRGMTARLQRIEALGDFQHATAREMRSLTGFDRVMIYRFAHDGSGEVIAEAAKAGLESYLGLHYPATDIPRQARILYERNWLRIIADVDAETSAIEPQLDPSGQPLDLSLSILRSVSPIHLEYLRNMGVKASMSVSILRGGKLWGLFACHHYAPYRPSFARRTAAELFGQMFSLQLESREREGEIAYEVRTQALHNKLVTAMAREATQLRSIVAHLDEIADLLLCDGIGVREGGKSVLQGLTPDEAQFGALMEHLDVRATAEVYATHEIGAEFPPGREFAARAAGMLVVPLSQPTRDYLVFFRKETLRSVNWAGDPAKPVTAGPLGARLTPRRSFELWQETVRGQSLPWLPVERRIAESLRVSLLEVILRLSAVTEAERGRHNERQELLIAELNHRVRNILALIRAIVNQSKSSAGTAEEFTEIVGGRIQALARAHDQITADNWGPASFQRLLQAEAGAYLGTKANRLVVTGPDVLIEPAAFTTVALVIHEMITNSAKYGALSDNRGRVEIDAAHDTRGWFALHWREQGGPRVRPPARRGFGSTVIERSIPFDLGGEARVEYPADGLQAWFAIPERFVRRAMEEEAARPVAPASTSPDIPADVLLVEDNVIIALDTEAMLLEMGAKDVRTATSVDRALKAIADRAPHFALLDVNLGVETSYEIAAKLAELGIPFAFATGYGEQVAFPSEFANAPRLRKPYTAESLREAVAGRAA